MVMAAGKNSLAEEKIKGNIDMTFIGENALSMLLVGEVEPKARGIEPSMNWSTCKTSGLKVEVD